MTKKFLVALALAGAALLTPSVFAATPCSTGAALQFVGVGSSAQFNTLAYAADDVITKSGTGPFNLFSVTGKDSLGNNTVQVLDSRPGVNKTDSATTWIMWDSGATCNVYTYWSVDSVVGVKDFLAYNSITVGGKVYSVQANYGEVSPDVETANFSGTECGGTTKCTVNKVGGLPDTATSVPSTVVVALSSIPANLPPAARPAYCGVNPKKAGSGQYCYFNAAGTDIRPEDAYVATVRALSTIDSLGHLLGLGYNNAACGGDGLATGSKIGCPFYDSFGGNKVFNSLLFKTAGTDPIGGGTIPSTTTFDVGAAPVVVFVNNGDTTASQGFGATDGSGNYIFHNINRQILAQVFQGRTHCTTDLLTTGAGVGKPIQVVLREALSGTYNTFEYTGVRTITGSGNPGVGIPIANGETSNEWSGQEQGINPALNFNTGAGCPGSGATAPNGSETCGDPVWIQSKSGGCGAGLRLRAIGTGEEVPAALGQKNSGASVVTDGIGYSFWSYGNFAPATAAAGHYLTVDGIDPLFTTPGGASDTKPNPDGAYNLPQCNLNSLPCFALPFTHILDGSYPLWNVLRIMSFANVGSGNAANLVTPPAVLNMIAYDEIEVADPARATSDFVPYLSGLTNSGTLTAPAWTGNLNLFVFRSHYLATGGPSSPDNGHHSCITGGVANFNGVALQGGSPTHATCLIDKGNDLGGSVLTVQSDVDWNLDAGTPVEEYDVRQ
jgi:hypothetical protein